MAELVDAHDSKSCAFGRAGSIPALGTKKAVISKRIDGFLLNLTEVWQQTVAPKYPFKLARLVHHRYNMKKRWYIVFYAWDVSKDQLTRYRMFEPLNRIKDRNKRLDEAGNIIRIINGQLRAGKVLGKEKLAGNIAPTTNLGKLSLQQAIDYVKEQKQANKYRESYVRSFKTLKSNIIGWLDFKKTPDFYIHQFNEVDAREFFQYLRDEKKLSNKTINGLITNLGIVMKFMEKNNDKQIWRKDPLRSFSLLPVVAKMHAAYTNEQIKKIKEKITEQANTAAKHRRVGYSQLQLCISFIYYAFARPKELRDLKVKHLQLKENRIYIPAETSKNKMDGMVEIAPQLKQQIIDSGITTYPEEYFVFGKNGVPGLTPINENFFWAKHQRILKKLDMDSSNHSLYGYKHSGVVNLYKATKDIKLIQRMCRHQTIEQTNAYLRDLGALYGYDQLKAYKGAV